MSTFQTIVYSVIHGFTEFLPISSSAHHALVPYIIGWDAPEGAFAGALTLGAFLALLVYFRHDWAAMTSSFLQVIIFRKRPMMIDERMPIFIILTSLPVAVAWYYLRLPISEMNWNPFLISASLAVFSLPLWFVDSFSRKNKAMADWNSLDALLVGVTQIALLIPGCGLQVGTLIGALGRNYNREAAAKFAFFAALPVLAGSAAVHLRGLDLHASQPMANLSWLSFTMAVIVTFFSGLLAIGGFMRNVQSKGFAQYLLYRFVFAGTVGVIYFIRSRTG
ncbi:MAG TPA: undecaprenyl-diphosphate phosphatase [Bdellovibrionota bacterium]|nr:undecaprenyl-diphosphate phosphatase [Bdellovibrionota bacterium]